MALLQNINSITIDGKMLRYIEIDDDRWYIMTDIKRTLGYRYISGDKNKVNCISPCNMKNISLKRRCSNGIPNHFIGINTRGVIEFILSSRKRTNRKLNEYFNVDIQNSSIMCKESQIGTAITEVFQDINIIPQYKVIRDNTIYYIDFYLPDHKIAIEIDEFGHADRNQIDEVDRQSYIEGKLDCQFIRCNPDDSKFNIFNLIFKVRMAIKA